MENTENFTNGMTYTDEFKHTVSKLGEDVKALNSLAKSIAHDSMNTVKEQGSSKLAEVEAALSDRTKQAQEKIKEAPLKSVMIGVGLGILCGALVEKIRS